MRKAGTGTATVAYNRSERGLAGLTFSNEGYPWPDDETPLQADAERGKDTPYWRFVIERQRGLGRLSPTGPSDAPSARPRTWLGLTWTLAPALEVNLLSTPTPRKLFGLWFEAAGQSVTVLPSALDELAPLLRIVVQDGVPVAAPPEPMRDHPAVRHQLEWVRQLHPDADGPYRFAPLTSEQSVAALEIRQRFSLACFPILSQREEIPAHRDAMIVSEALACGLEIIITNNMTSIDHFEVNDWPATSSGPQLRPSRDRRRCDVAGPLERSSITTAARPRSGVRLAARWRGTGRRRRHRSA